MNLPNSTIREIKHKTEEVFENRWKNNKLLIKEKKDELAKEETKLISIKEKWISNQIAHDTYQRWFNDLTQRMGHLKAQINRLSEDQGQLFKELYRALDILTDLKYVYHECGIPAKQELIRQGFDSNLYYQQGIYRTPTMLDIFQHNIMKMSERGVLIFNEIKKPD